MADEEMSKNTDTSKKSIYIHQGRDGDKSVVLHPVEDDLFMRTGRQVIAACQLDISIELWFNEFTSMCDYVKGWSDTKSNHVRACFVVSKSSRVIFFFIPHGGHFDFELADQLAILNGELVKKYNVGPVEIHQIPWDERDRFLDVGQTRHIYGDSPAAHHSVEA